jgi:hypothetical protein
VVVYFFKISYQINHQKQKTEDNSLQNIPMASPPIPQNQADFNTGELVVGEGVVLKGSFDVPNKA